MTLREQIKAIHAKHFNPEFHEYRKDIIPAMVNDLAEKFFDDLLLTNLGRLDARFWVLENTVEIRAIKLARGLIKHCQMREDTPAAE